MKKKITVEIDLFSPDKKIDRKELLLSVKEKLDKIYLLIEENSHDDNYGNADSWILGAFEIIKEKDV